MRKQAQRGHITCAQPHSCHEAELGFQLRQDDLRTLILNLSVLNICFCRIVGRKNVSEMLL